MQSKDGLKFIDFEYAGLDDLSKLVGDWVVQPEYVLNTKQEEILINEIHAGMDQIIGSSWIERLIDVKPLMQIKWCLIMLRNFQFDHTSETVLIQRLEKIKNYYELA